MAVVKELYCCNNIEENSGEEDGGGGRIPIPMELCLKKKVLIQASYAQCGGLEQTISKP